MIVFRYTYTPRSSSSRNGGKVRPVSNEFRVKSIEQAHEEIRKIRAKMKRFGGIIDHEILEQGFMKEVVLVTKEFVSVRSIFPVGVSS